MANTFRNEDYQSPKTLGNIAIGLLGGLIVCSFLIVIFSLGLAMYPDSVLDAGDGETLPIAYGLIGIVALLHIPVYVGTIVFFLIWEHRAFNNLSALRANYLEFSPGWAVGWWFIPFANLVKPFQAMRELWVESDPESDPDLAFLTSKAGAPTIMGFWWAAWLLTNITSNISNKMDGSEFFATSLIIASILEIVAAALLISIMLDINRRQEMRFDRLGAMQPTMPPPPPTF